jgi:uncharacterized membrane protein (DUF2068 family)
MGPGRCSLFLGLSCHHQSSSFSPKQRARRSYPDYGHSGQPGSSSTEVIAVPSSGHKALRSVAIFEALKGGLVLVAGFGLLSFLGRDTELLAERIVHHLHLDPLHRYPRIFIHAMSELTNTNLWLLAGFAALYATIRFVEAYGLWHVRRWAEWLAALSGGVYLPVEIYEVMHRVSWLKTATLVSNLVVVAYMAWLLTEARRRKST